MRFTIFSMTLLLATLSINAQSENEPKNTLKANPLGLIIGIGKINYERKLSETTSAQLGASYFNYSADGLSLSGLALAPEYRFYTGDAALKGFFLAPFLKYNNVTLKDEDQGFKGSLNAFAIGAKGGFQWLLGKQESFVIDLAFGGKYSDFNLKVKEGSEDAYDNEDLFHGFSPELHFAIGFAF